MADPEVVPETDPIRVVALSYRAPAAEIEYVAGVEASNCDWCRWLHKDPSYRRCYQPQQRHRSTSGNPAQGECSDWNREGTCNRFAPTLFTRFLRIVRLRAPAWRSP